MGVVSELARLIRLGFPEEVAKRIVSGELDMSAEARMDRALDQGFDPDEIRFHATDSDIAEFNVDKIGSGPGKTPKTFPQGFYFGRNPNDLEDYYSSDGGNIIPVLLRRGEVESGTDFDAFKRFNEGDADTYRSASGVEVVKNPSDIRSVNAAFDPQYKGANILGSALLPAATAGLLATQSDDAEAGFVTRGGKTLLEAWHGSPHKFDKFSMDAIGTGEGAQAYGHGLYFADNEGVAKGYREALTQPRIETNGKVVPSPYTSDILETFSDEVAEETRIQAESWADLFELQAEAVGKPIDREVLDDWIEAVISGKESDFPTEKSRQMAQLEDEIGMSQNDVYDVRERVEDAFAMIGGNLSQIDSMDQISYVTEGLPKWAQPVYDRYFDGKMMEVAPEGALYRTEIDVTPESLLDYDLPVRSQPKSVQDALVNAYRAHVNDGSETGLLMSDLMDGATPQDALNIFDDSKGSQAYRTLADMIGGEAKASQMLNQQGVRGIKFADGNSRRAKQAMIDGKSDGFSGDENYVIFDDSLINIAERGNATPEMIMALALGSGGATAAASEGLGTRLMNHIGDNVNEVLDLLEKPQRGLQGLIRAGYGLTQGESLDAALNAGADVVNNGVEAAAEAAGDKVLEETGSPELAAMAYMAAILGSPI